MMIFELEIIEIIEINCWSIREPIDNQVYLNFEMQKKRERKTNNTLVNPNK